MADEQIVTSIVAKADLSSLVSEVHRATASLQQLQRELLASNKSIASATKVANNLFRDTLTGSGYYSSHFVNLNSDVDKFGKQLDAGRLKLKDYFQTFRTHATTQKGLIRELAKEQVMLQNAVLQPLGRNAQGLMQYNVMIPRGLDAVKNSAQLARMEMQIMNRALSEGATSLINWGKNTQWAGRQLTVGLTVPLAMFGSQAAKAFREADQELTRLVKVYGDISGTASADLQKIRKDVTLTAKELSSAMGVSFKETIGLAADIAATGQQGDELLSSLKETTRLAVLGEVDRQEAMKATLAIQTAFKSNTQQLTESINFLNAVENQTSTTLNDLVEAIPKAGTVVKQLGGDVKDLALYLTAMREGGVNASEAANALKSGLASMINPTKQTIGVMSDFGIDIMGMVQKNTGDTTGMILDLQKALDGLDPLSKARALEQMFGKFQFARMAALFNNLGKSGSQTLQVMDLMRANAEQLAGIASRELTLVTESASGKYRRAIEGLRASLADVGEEFLGVATKFINAFTKVLDFFNNLPGPIKKAVTYLGGFTAVIGPIIMLTGVLANFFGYITKGIVQLRAFFQRASGWKMLTPEIIAAEKAAQMVEKSFYGDAAAAEVLHGALTKLIADYMSLQSAMTKGTVPVNPALSTVAGSMVMSPLRRVVDANDPYAGELNTRAMSHINPRDPENPATFLGGVPGAIPVNQKIGRTPQIYMHDRLPDVPGITTVKGVSTGIVASEAARYHALLSTLAMQTEAEVAALKKTISLGGTVSADLLNTFDDILPLTSSIADNAAQQSAGIVAQLRAGKLTAEQARAEIMAINAQMEAQLQRDIAAYAATRGRTIDFTKAPMMNQPVVDANGQFTLRDLYKKEANRAVMEEFGRLRGVRTFGAPYSIQTTRLPKLNSGGPIGSSSTHFGNIETFGPGKTVVSGDTSINYDDRLGRVPVGGYVLNQSASMNPANSAITDPDVVASTYNSGGGVKAYNPGGEITAALTPGEIVYGPKLQKDPVLYAAVEAANNGYNFGGQIVRSIGNYGLWDDYKSRYAILERYDASEDWMKESKFRMKMAASSALVDMGVDPKLAVQYAHEDVEKAFNDSMTKSGRINRAEFKRNAKIISTKRHRVLQKQIGKSLVGVNAGQVALHAGAVAKNPSAAIGLLNELLNNKAVVGQIGMDEADRIFKRLLGISARHLQMTPDNLLAGLLGDPKYNKVVMEHVSPRDIDRTSSQGKWGYSARGHYLQAFAGEKDINLFHNRLGEVRKQKLWGNFVALDNPHAKSLVNWGLKTQMLGSMSEYQSSINKGAVGNKKFNIFRALLSGQMPMPRGLSLMPRASFVDARGNTGGAIMSRRIAPTRKNYAGPSFNLGGPIGGGRITPGRSNYGRRPAGFRRGEMGTGRQARREGTFGHYNPGNVLFDSMIGPVENALFMYTGHLQAMSKNVATEIIKGSAIIGSSLKTSGSYIASAYSEFGRDAINKSRDLKNRMMNYLPSLPGKSDILREQAAVTARAYPGTMMPVSLFGPGVVGDWKQTGQDGIQTRKVGSIGFRRREYMVGDQVMSAKQMRSAGMQVPMRMGGGASQMALMMGSQAAGMGLMGQGQTQLGTAVMTAGMVASFLPFGRMLNALKRGATGVSTAIKGITTAGLTASKVIAGLLRFAKGFGPLGIAISAVAEALNLWKKANDNRQDSAMSMSMTARGAEQAGIKYFNLAETMKLVKERQDAIAAGAKGASATGAGMPGLVMSIEEMKKAKEEGKGLKEMIESINRTKTLEETIQLVSNQKAQFVAAGMSAAEANKKIYGALANSEKANSSFRIFADQTFGSITDKASAAQFAVKNLLGAIKEGNKSDIGNGFESLINTFQEAQNKLIGTKDSMGELIDQYRAFQMTISSMGASNPGMNQAIGSDAYEALLKTQPLLAAISNEADSMAGVLAKWQLFTSNVNINLKQIDSTLALKIAGFTSAIDSGISAMAKSGGDANTFGTVGAALLKLDGIAKSVSRNAQRNAAAAQKNLQEELKLIQKKIKLIEEEKNKKLEALNATQDKENYQLELQKLQIEYQDAIANGDMARAAQAQISMQQLTKNRQADLARKAIEDEAAAKIKPLEADAERKNRKGEDIQNRMAASQDRAADASEAAGKISGFSGRYNELVKTQISNELIADQSERNAAMAATQEQILALIKEIQTAGTGKGYEAEQIRSAFSKYFDKSGKAVPMTTTTSGYVGSRFQTTTSPSSAGAGIIANDIAAAKAQATAITGGTTIEKLRSDLLVALGKNPGVTPSGNNSTGVVANDAGKRGSVPVSGTTENQKTGNREKITPGLTEISASRIVNGGRLKVGDLLVVGRNGSIRPAISLSDGTIKKSGQMKVENIFSNSEGQRVQLSVYRAQGGRIVPGVPYALNDGGKIEGIKFDMPGTVYPNAMTMPKYNVGGPIQYGRMAYGNPAPSNNALYNINVTLNGTDLSAEDVAQAIHKQMRVREIAAGVGRRV
jgi:TP901 family phage tail tape measure protein